MTLRTPPGRVAIVVATHRRDAVLASCLQSFCGLLTDPADLVFVDNGSQGLLRDWVRRVFPQICVLVRPDNGHFCGGYNTGVRHALDAGYDFVLIANADTEVCHRPFLCELLDAAQRHRRAAFLGPLVYLRRPGTVQGTILDNPDFLGNVRKWFALRWWRREPADCHRAEREVDFLNGVCVLCRSTALRQIGLMDETMGGYVEDTDWSWRARQAGWSSVFVPVPSIVHHECTTGYEQYSLRSFMLRRNTIYWHLKCGRPTQAGLYALASLLLAGARCWQAQRTGEAARQHRYFLCRFWEVSWRLLCGQTPGRWFGPPIGPWAPRC